MINYVKTRSPYKRSTQSILIGFLFGCDSRQHVDMSTNEEIAKTLAELSKSVRNLSELPGSVKSQQDELEMLKYGATQSGVNPQPTGLQYSEVDLSAGPVLA